MPRKSNEPLQKHTFNLFEGDMHELQIILDGLPAERRIKASEFMRVVLRQYLTRVKAKVERVEGIEL